MDFVDRRPGHIASALVVIALLSACTPSRTPAPTSRSSEPPASTSAATSGPTIEGTRPGGTIYLLHSYEELGFLDPQRVYTFEDVAFLGATIQRSLVTYASSPDPIAGTTLVPDMATDLGRATDGGRTWSFTLRDGVTWQDGSDVTCEDVKYGVSRTFANNVINQGPTYALSYLDIPANPVADDPNDPKSEFLSAYYGPYDGTGQDLFDKAVACSPDHRTITFRLKQPVADFDYTVTLGFGAVPQAADTGETYGQPDNLAWSNGPYVIESYRPGTSGTLILVRNPNWDPASDPVRRAYPDRWVVHFGLDPEAIDHRLIESAGDDAFALQATALLPATAATIFDAAGSPTAAFQGRAVSGFAQYARYMWINTVRIPNRQIRQAILVALDRAAIRDIHGGPLYGDFADGVLMPSIGRDYAPTGIWDGYFGRVVPSSGDPELARELIAASGQSAPEVTFTAPNTPTNAEVGKIVVDSLARAGIQARYEPICDGYGCGIVFDPRKGADLGLTGWGSDWPNASTVIPALFTADGGWNQSWVDDPAFAAAVDDALGTLDRAEQARKWQELNRTIVENAWVVPTFFSRSQRLAGSRIAPIYAWPAYNSWPYGELYVTP